MNGKSDTNLFQVLSERTGAELEDVQETIKSLIQRKFIKRLDYESLLSNKMRVVFILTVEGRRYWQNSKKEAWQESI